MRRLDPPRMAAELWISFQECAGWDMAGAVGEELPIWAGAIAAPDLTLR
jgi:hypothetical protein